MKKLSFVAAATLIAASCSFGADGATIYKFCATCHGQNAEKSYLNKVPVLTTIDAAERLDAMKKYKAGELNKYGMGAVMKGNMVKYSEEDMAAVNDYISTLK